MSVKQKLDEYPRRRGIIGSSKQAVSWCSGS